jgi:GNAT superfamily N-acetyltransferase
MQIIIKEVINAADRKLFINLPYSLYRDEKLWVPPLMISQKEILSEKYPFWKKNKHCFFLAFQNDQCVGRIATFIDRDYEAHFGKRQGFFGFLEAIDDENVFKLLLSKAEDFLRSLDCSSLIGPVNPSIHHELGILIEGFDHSPFFMITYNKVFYNKHMIAAGFGKLKDFYSYQLNTDHFQLTEKMARVKSIIKEKQAITLRTPDLKNFNNELKIFQDIYNNSFIGHWGFSPLGWEDFQILGKDMKMIIDKELVLIVEKGNEPIGFLLAIPNLNEVLIRIKNGRLFPFGIFKFLFLKSKVKSLRVITVAIKREFQHLGIGSILYPEIAYRAKQRGYDKSELSWVVEDNVQMNKIIHGTGAVVYKKHRLYEKSIFNQSKTDS